MAGMADQEALDFMEEANRRGYIHGSEKKKELKKHNKLLQERVDNLILFMRQVDDLVKTYNKIYVTRPKYAESYEEGFFDGVREIIGELEAIYKEHK